MKESASTITGHYSAFKPDAVRGCIDKILRKNISQKINCTTLTHKTS
jgi:hypothetical protein